MDDKKGKILKLILEYLISGFMSILIFLVLGVLVGYLVVRNLEPVTHWLMNFLGIG